jgi:mRNA interferase MazF
VVKRGEIWQVNLDPTVGSEIRKLRPCVVVSPAELHDHLRTVIVAPMTSQGFAAPFRVPVTHAGKKGLILLDQIRTVDKRRLAKRLAAVSPKTLRAALAVLQDVFAP